MLARDVEVGITPLFLWPFAHRAWSPPTSSSLAEEKRLRSLLLSTAARDYRRSRPVARGSYRARSTRASSQTGSVDSYTLPSAPKIKYLSKLRANQRS
jgi:hypothetical protein